MKYQETTQFFIRVYLLRHNVINNLETSSNQRDNQAVPDQKKLPQKRK